MGHGHLSVKMLILSAVYMYILNTVRAEQITV